ncbi:MAG: hypothetical protein ACYTGH_01190 [Planctomycetota bacterium]
MSTVLRRDGVLGRIDVLPLLPGVALAGVTGKARTSAYFFFLGIGFMLLEMGFLHRFMLYLASPASAATVVIGGLLIFAGVGSCWSARDPEPGSRRIRLAAVGILLYLIVAWLFLDYWLALSQVAALPWRQLLALLALAPLGFAMGQMFPAGLRLVRLRGQVLVPWAWGVNGFGSVLAAITAPLVAMSYGFGMILALAASAYLIAALLAGSLGPERLRGR